MENTSTLCECVRACVCDVFAIYDNNISPSLLMIIIKIIILYFIQFQIRHTDNFPPTGTPASCYNDNNGDAAEWKNNELCGAHDDKIWQC